MRMRICWLFLLLLGSGLSVVQAAPVIRVNEPVWNAGVIVSGTTYEKVVMIENAGNEPLIIKEIEQCCGVNGYLPGKVKILPNEKASLRLELDPYQKIGDLKAEIVLISNDPENPNYSITVAGTIVPKMHALGELKEKVVDLGVVNLRDRVPFTLNIRSYGNSPFVIQDVEKTAVTETGARPVIGAGAEQGLSFEYVPRQKGPIEETIKILSNDALRRVLSVQVKGYVTGDNKTEHGLFISPIGIKAPYDGRSKSYRYDFTISNTGAMEVAIVKAEGSQPGVTVNVPSHVQVGQSVGGSASIPLSGTAGNGYLYLQLAIPYQIQ